jgi:hypothetical protein
VLEEWLSEQDTAAALHKTKRTLRKWRRRGIGPPYAYFGRTVRYHKSSLEEHFRQNEITPVRAMHPMGRTKRSRAPDKRAST